MTSPLIIGIAGGSGSGKSTVARKLAEALAPAAVGFLDMDAYYRDQSHRPMEDRKHHNWDHPDALDLDLLVEHLDRLAAGQPIEKPVYDFVHHVRAPETVPIAPGDAIVLDGILTFVDPRVRDRCAVKVFVDADADERLVRRIRRDMRKRGRPLEEILDQYLHTVAPMHLQFVEPSKRYADLIIPRGGHNAIGIDVLVAMVRQRLAPGAA